MCNNFSRFLRFVYSGSGMIFGQDIVHFSCSFIFIFTRFHPFVLIQILQFLYSFYKHNWPDFNNSRKSQDQPFPFNLIFLLLENLHLLAFETFHNLVSKTEILDATVRDIYTNTMKAWFTSYFKKTNSWNFTLWMSVFQSPSYFLWLSFDFITLMYSWCWSSIQCSCNGSKIAS